MNLTLHARSEGPRIKPTNNIVQLLVQIFRPRHDSSFFLLFFSVRGWPVRRQVATAEV
ncbi:MAG: hypothetical protein U1E12_22200 [Hydrogenophaga sp.]|uniref:hypothetical protein n=1 Tax=Hydrogenophaga sp. TaxID=1904254 RepID=UPI002ABA402D|nr:hypothetical protein [Hydrogenophaga sp.]MDZ4104384.1 hypothetical protein [Hydrogenophaga sp.]